MRRDKEVDGVRQNTWSHLVASVPHNAPAILAVEQWHLAGFSEVAQALVGLNLIHRGSCTFTIGLYDSTIASQFLQDCQQMHLGISSIELRYANSSRLTKQSVSIATFES